MDPLESTNWKNAVEAPLGSVLDKSHNRPMAKFSLKEISRFKPELLINTSLFGFLSVIADGAILFILILKVIFDDVRPPILSVTLIKYE